MGEGIERPRIVPAEEDLAALPTPLNVGERATLEALKLLGPDWIIFVQPRVALAQPDFVALHPEKGLWIIEVKDWNPEYYRQVGNVGGRYLEVFSGDDWISRQSPRLRVAAYQQIFQERFFSDSKLRSSPSHSVRGMLVLPQFSSEEASTLFGRYPNISRDDLTVLAMRIEGEADAPIDPDAMQELLYWLDEPEFVGDQRLPVPLSSHARAVVENPKGVKTRRVRGPAGSGKSLALAARAIALAGEGKAVLIVTYNITLSHYLRDLCSRASRERRVRHWKQAVTFTYFHGMLRELWIQREQPKTSFDTWTDEVISILTDAYSRPAHDLPKFDAILVDEGQDFESQWWNFLRSQLLKADGEILLIADRTQNIYDRRNWAGESMTGGGFTGPWMELKGTYRMPVDLIPIVAEFGSRYLADEEPDLPTIELDHPAGHQAHKPTIRRWINTNRDSLVHRSADAVEAMFRDNESVSPSDVVLLADHDLGSQIMRELKNRGNDIVSVFTEEDDDLRRGKKNAFWGGRPGIKGCTVQSFKGWEARAVVCVATSKSEVSLYIAMTRVKSAPGRSALITVVNSEPKLGAFKSRFEREIDPSEVPALAGQASLDI
jgi:hypothetical protein